MPELPDVERVVRMLRDTIIGRVVDYVWTKEDKIVFADGITDLDFAIAVHERKVRGVGRYGKVFYLDMEGEGPHPVMHLGMTGNVYIRGTEPAHYKSSSKNMDSQWPPRFMKFILEFEGVNGTPPIEVVFVDPRRLGRIRLCSDPFKQPPISKLGFDPIICMPSLSEFTPQVRRHANPIKSLLLDQKFSAGIGNWIADEVLFHSRIHPEQRPNTLTDDQIATLHEKIVYVCQTAVGVNADSSLFPESWLFHRRWGKGKKQTSELRLPSGETAVIKWITVGSRTSAFVPKVQILTSIEKEKGKAALGGVDEPLVPQDSSSNISEISDEEVPKVTKMRRAMSAATADANGEQPPKPNRRKRRLEGAEDSPSNGRRRKSARLAQMPTTSRYFDHA